MKLQQDGNNEWKGDGLWTALGAAESRSASAGFAASTVAAASGQSQYPAWLAVISAWTPQAKSAAAAVLIGCITPFLVHFGSSSGGATAQFSPEVQQVFDEEITAVAVANIDSMSDSELASLIGY